MYGGGGGVLVRVDDGGTMGVCVENPIAFVGEHSVPSADVVVVVYGTARFYRRRRGRWITTTMARRHARRFAFVHLVSDGG